MNNKTRPTFSVIHDDEFRTLNADVVEQRIIKNDITDWQDDWKEPPADEFLHQFRKNYFKKEQVASNHQQEELPN